MTSLTTKIKVLLSAVALFLTRRTASYGEDAIDWWKQKTNPLREAIEAYFPVIGSTISRGTLLAPHSMVSLLLVGLLSITTIFIYPEASNSWVQYSTLLSRVFSFPPTLLASAFGGLYFMGVLLSDWDSFLYYRKPSARTYFIPTVVLGFALASFSYLRVEGSVSASVDSIILLVVVPTLFAHRKFILDNKKTFPFETYPTANLAVTRSLAVHQGVYYVLTGSTIPLVCVGVSGCVLAYCVLYVVKENKYSEEYILENLESERQGVEESVFFRVAVEDNDVEYEFSMDASLPDRMYKTGDEYLVAKRKAESLLRVFEEHMPETETEERQRMLRQVGDVVEWLDNQYEENDGINKEPVVYWENSYSS